jgi:hypothetical protein
VQLADVALGIGGFVMDGEAEYDSVGLSVSGAGDVNGDGLADVIVGAHAADAHGERSGRAYVVFGKTSTDSLSLADVTSGIGGFAMDGEAELDAAGGSESTAGDINGDGLADVVVGATGVDANGDGSGRTYVVFGKTDTGKIELSDVARGHGGFAIDGEAGDDHSGAEVTAAGDANGDGVPDVIVSAPDASPNGPSSGRTYVVFGGDFSCE